MHYCTITTPNITFAINKSCQFLQALSTHQWVTTKRLLCYLKGTSNYEATLHKSSHMELIVFSDTDQASCPYDRHKTGAFHVFLGKSPTSLKSNKQKVMSRSSEKSEYGVVAQVSQSQLTLGLVCNACKSLYALVNRLLEDISKRININFVTLTTFILNEI